jgi:hypothetical protein
MPETAVPATLRQSQGRLHARPTTQRVAERRRPNEHQNDGRNFTATQIKPPSQLLGQPGS